MLKNYMLIVLCRHGHLLNKIMMITLTTEFVTIYSVKYSVNDRINIYIYKINLKVFIKILSVI